MIQSKESVVYIKIYTDGDFAIDNKDGYFNNFDDYKYRKKIVNRIQWFSPCENIKIFACIYSIYR